MKTLHYITWISGGLAVIIIILGLLQLFFEVNLFGINKSINYFHVANSFFLLTICCLLYKKPAA